MPLITYADKVQLNSNPDIPDNQKCMAKDMNEIKKAINDLIRPVGSYYETSDTSFDPNVTWGGTWELETDGTVLVSKSSTSGSKFDADVGTVIGEEEHTLTHDELPKTNYFKGAMGTYDYNNALPDGAGIPSGSSYYGLKYPYVGKDQAHNNVQPSKVINRWHRTA